MKNGLIYVITGNGKGKTTSACGLALRAAGHGKKTLIIQFVKSGSWKSGEIKYIEKHIPEIDVFAMGQGFVGIIDDNKSKKIHQKSALDALDFALKKLKEEKYNILILDEINVAISLKLIDKNKIIEFLKTKPKNLHVVLTGRNASPELIKMADLVSEIKKIKHPYDHGILAQKGIDF